MPSSPKLNARQARHLEFQAAPVPKFLQAFKDKVQPAPRRSELDDALGVGSSRGVREDGLLPDSDGEGEDEWEGAHVVVLDDKKNLTLEEARQASHAQSENRVDSKEDEPPSASAVQASQPGAPIRSKRRAAPIGQSDDRTRKISRVEDSNKEDGMDSVRALIAERKAAPSKPRDEKLERRVLIEEDDPRDKAKAKEQRGREVASKASAKEVKRRKKNQAARKEIKKSGKGLSFDMDD